MVEYIASSPDSSGRVYARQACAQLLPRSVRLLVYGRTHKEIDMSGAHYEIDRRLVQSPTVPPIDVLREQLRRVWHGHVEELLNVEVNGSLYASSMQVLQPLCVISMQKGCRYHLLSRQLPTNLRLHVKWLQRRSCHEHDLTFGVMNPTNITWH